MKTCANPRCDLRLTARQIEQGTEYHSHRCYRAHQRVITKPNRNWACTGRTVENPGEIRRAR